MNTPEYYYNLGAKAMQSHIAAYFMMKNKFDIAPLILKLPIPRFQIPEEQIMEEKK